jgi:hypothetical protein
LKTRSTAIPMIVVFMLALIAAGFTAKADTRFIGIDEIRPGMRGKALTVLEGTKIESFGVEILGLTTGTGRVGSLILIRTYGTALREFGGIASGMSGSPVFIGNRLLGAISYTFSNANPSYGLVTPIADMLALWDYKDTEDYMAEFVDGQPVNIAGQNYRGILFAGGHGQGVHNNRSDLLKAIPVTAPIYLGGFGQRTGAALQSFLGKYGVSVAKSAASSPLTPAPLSPSGETIASLEPGSPLGLQLITGDLSVSSIGTLTWVENGRFVAFGHPVLSKGKVALLATGASVYRTISGASVPSKLADITNPVGIITQDRSAGLAGRFGKMPVMLPVVVQVTDQDTGNEVVLKTSVVLDADMTPTLASMAVIEGLDRALDRVGAGSAKIDLEVLTAGSRADLRRQNLFYHRTDVASIAIMDLLGYLNFLFRNNFEDVRPLAVNVSAVVCKDNFSAVITDARTAQDIVQPGETVDLVVQLRPYRSALAEVTIPVKIPDNAAPGRLDFFISGGTLWTEDAFEEEDILNNSAADFAEAYREWTEKPANMHIIVRYAPDTADSEAIDDSDIILLTETDWFVQGSRMISIEIVDPANE